MPTKSDTAELGGTEVNSQIADTVSKLRQMAPAEATALAKSAAPLHAALPCRTPWRICAGCRC